MGAGLPCSATGDCCGKENQDIYAFRARGPGDRLPGLRLDLPVAVDQARSAKSEAKEANLPDVETQPPAPQTASRDCSEPASPRSLPPGDNDNDSQDFFILPPGDSHSEDERQGGAGSEAGTSSPNKAAESESERLPEAGPGPGPLGPAASKGGIGTGAGTGPSQTEAGHPSLDELAGSRGVGERTPGDGGQAEHSVQASEAEARRPSAEEASKAQSQATAGGLVLGFELPDGSRRIVDFGSRKPPMGLDFAKASPIPVHRVKPGGHGADLGIRPGWEVMSINGQDLHGVPFDEAMQILAKAAWRCAGEEPPAEATPRAAGAAGVPTAARSQAATAAGATPSSAPPPAPAPGLPGLTIGFLLPDGSERAINFGTRKPPLGMDFDRVTPITVKKVKPGQHAEELGIEPGWQVIHVNDKSVEGKSAMEVFQIMKMATLPPRP